MGAEVKQIFVVDLQPDTTTAEAEELLNEPLSRGYFFQYISSGWEQIVARAFFRQPGNLSNRHGKDDVAMALLKAYPKYSLRESVERNTTSGAERFGFVGSGTS